MADENNVQSLIDIKATTSGVDQATVSTNKLGDAVDGVAVKSDSLSKANLSVERSFDTLQKRVDTTYRAMQQQQKSLGDLDRARGAGLVTDARYAELQALIAQRYDDVVSGANRLGQAHASMSTQGLAAAHAIRTGVEELALGVPVTQVAAQQFSHLSYAASGPGGLSGAFSEAAGMFGRFTTTAAAFVTPAIATAGVLGTLTVGAVAAGVAWSASQSQITQALSGIGRQSGATAADINAIAEASANSSTLTISSARQVASVLVSTGQVGTANLASATTATDGLAKAMGVDAADAAKLMAAALADPAKGADELHDKIGGLDNVTRELIATALRNGDTQQAQAILIQGVVSATQTAIKANQDYGLSFSDLWKSIRDGADLYGKDLVQGFQLARHDLGGAGPTAGVSKQQQLATAQGNLAKLQAGGPEAFTFNPDSADLKNFIDRLTAATELVRKLKEEANAESLAPWNAQLENWAARADRATNAMVPQIAQTRQLEEAVSDLTRAQNFADVASRQTAGGGNSAALVAAENQLRIVTESQGAAQRYNHELQVIGQSWQGVGLQTAQALQHLQNQLPVSQAVGNAAKMEAQYYATINNLRAQGLTQEEAIALAAGQYQQSQAQAIAGAQQQTQALNDQNELAKAQTLEQQKQIASAQAYKQVLQDTGSVQEASNRAAAVQEQYQIKINQQLKANHDATVQWQQALLSTTNFAAGFAGAMNGIVQTTAQEAQALENAARAASMVGITDSGGQQGTNWGFDTAKGEQGTFGGGFIDPLGSGQVITQAVQFARASPAAQIGRFISEHLSGGIVQAIAALSAPGSIGDYGLLSLGAVDPELVQSNIDSAKTQAISGLIDDLAAQGTGALPQLQQLLGAEKGNGTIVGFEAVAKINQAIASLEKSVDNNTTSTTDNTVALNSVAATLPGVLSSLYSSGQVAGFGFADGGIMTSRGPLPLRAYGDGGVVSTPQIFAAGENYKPEAIIPLRNGAVPVQLAGGPGGGSSQTIIAPTFNNYFVIPAGDPGGGVRMAAGTATEDMMARLQRMANR